MQVVHYKERDGRWWLSDTGIEFRVATDKEITVEGCTTLLATALTLALEYHDEDR